MILSPAIKNAWCQVTNSAISFNINEKIWMHTDRNFYIAGERIWFRIYLVTEPPLSPGGFSRVAYVELLNNSNEVISKQKVKTDCSGGPGYLVIPDNIPSGLYFIRSYTNWMENFNPAGYFLSSIAVINPSSPLYKYRDTTLIQDTDMALDTIVQNGTVMEYEVKGQSSVDNISGNKLHSGPEIIFQNINKEYGRRKKVEFEIQTTGKDGKPIFSDISVSVYYSGDKEFDPPVIQNYLSSYSDMDPDMIFKPGNKRNYLFIPEMEAVTISGRIIESSGQNPVQDVPVILSVVGENAFLKSYLTRADGRFSFSINDLYGEHDIVLNCDNDEKELVIFIDEPYSQDFIDLPFIELSLDETWRSFIERQLINYQLTSLYAGRKFSHNTVNNSLKEPFYIKPDITVKMEDFIRLPNMEEVFRELVKQVLVTKQSGNLILNILDINTNRIIGPEPLFILDGVPLFDPGLIFELNPEDIKVINIVCHKYFKGILEMDGIIDIRTNELSLPVSELPVNYRRQSFQGYQQPEDYLTPDYSDEEKIKSRIPDFRNLLYWNPSLSTSIEGKVSVSFYTSDNTGSYEISVTGVSAEGLFKQTSCIFKVQK
jgi:hypothetical protein